MTETQAKSGGPGTSATPDEAAKKDAAADGREPAGRAAVPADASSPPKFTRAPGMAPPPGELPADTDSSDAKRPGGPAIAKGSATVPIVTKGKGAAPRCGRRASGAGPSRPGADAAASGRSGPAGRRRWLARPSPGGPHAASRQRRTGRPPPPARPRSARPGSPRRSGRPARRSPSAAGRGPRRARLNLKRIDPWSVMKFSFAVSVVLFIVVVVATSVLYLALDTMGVWTSVNGSLKTLVSASGGADASAQSSFRITAWGVIGTSMLIGAVNVVLFTALATLGAFIYNVCADLVGGVELTLAERD